MTEPWFNPNMYAWMPGTLLGVAGGIEGTLTGLCAPRGKCKTLVLGMHVAILGACSLLLVAGVVALVTGQPYGIWYSLGLPGLLGVVIFGALTPVLHKRYMEAEMRKSMAQDL
jgi:hypothetical protein